jgi:electron transport complex protein RnfG
MWPFARVPQEVTRREAPRLVATLALAGLVSGLAIVGSYRLTLPTIRENQAAALRRAVLEVLPGAERLERLEWRDAGLVAAESEAADPDPAGDAGDDGGGELIGYAIPAAGAGYQDTISLIYGFDPATRRIVGMQVLESRETPGLGDKIYRDDAFVAQFRDLAVDPAVVLVKEEPTAANQVDAITGATISSRAVVGIIERANRQWLGRLPGGAPEGPEPDAPPGSPVPGGRISRLDGPEGGR